nr:hypothetical protein [Cryobacterium sp.]
MFLTGTSVVVDEEPVASRPDDLIIGAWWLPSAGAQQPFHDQMMDAIDPVSGSHRFGLSWYVPIELQSDNRVDISDTEVDALGMPRLRLHFSLTDTDQENVRLGHASQLKAAAAVGTFDEATAGELPIGGSLHSTGTGAWAPPTTASPCATRTAACGAPATCSSPATASCPRRWAAIRR